MKPGAWSRIGLGVALSLGLLSAAQALVFVPTNPDGSVTWQGGVAGTSFSETYQFNLSSGQFTLTMVDNGFVEPWTSLALQAQNGTGTTTLGSLSGFGSFNFTTSSAGLYQAVLNGVPTSPASSFGVTIAPVPEPEIWAMMMVGMGLLGFQLKKRGAGSRSA